LLYAGVVVTLVFDAVSYGALLFSYLYLFTVRGTPWPPPGYEVLGGADAGLGAALLAAMPVVGFLAVRLLRGGRSLAAAAANLVLAALHVGAVAALLRLLETTSARADAYGAVLWTIGGYTIAHAAVTLLMLVYVFLAQAAGRLDAARPLALENTALVSHYTALAGLAGLALIVLFPAWIGHG
jgi:cytochrome c oxidase subunit I+III